MMLTPRLAKTRTRNDLFENKEKAFLKANFSTAFSLGGVCGNAKQNRPYIIDIIPENFRASANLAVTPGTSSPDKKGGIS